jgi:hypothetical protein
MGVRRGTHHNAIAGPKLFKIAKKSLLLSGVPVEKLFLTPYSVEIG